MPKAIHGCKSAFCVLCSPVLCAQANRWRQIKIARLCAEVAASLGLDSFGIAPPSSAVFVSNMLHHSVAIVFYSFTCS